MNMPKLGSPEWDEVWLRLINAIRHNKLPGLEGWPVQTQPEDWMLMSVADNGTASFKHRHTRNYIQVRADGALLVPDDNQPFLHGKFMETPAEPVPPVPAEPVLTLPQGFTLRGFELLPMPDLALAVELPPGPTASHPARVYWAARPRLGQRVLVLVNEQAYRSNTLPLWCLEDTKPEDWVDVGCVFDEVIDAVCRYLTPDGEIESFLWVHEGGLNMLHTWAGPHLEVPIELITNPAEGLEHLQDCDVDAANHKLRAGLAGLRQALRYVVHWNATPGRFNEARLCVRTMQLGNGVPMSVPYIELHPITEQ